jgi:hypothetical protein
MNSDTPSSNNAPDAPTYFGADRRVFVLFSIAVVAVMFVGMVGLLYFREQPAATALLVLRVPPSLDGAIATVDTKFNRDLSPIVTTLEGGQEVRIPLPPGEYIVKIEHKTRKIRAETILGDYSYFPLILEDPSATQPTTRSKSK